jgi:hypothetical protein
MVGTLRRCPPYVGCGTDRSEIVGSFLIVAGGAIARLVLEAAIRFVVVIGILTLIGLFIANELASIEPDEYPNYTHAISNAIKSRGAGVYDLVMLAGLQHVSAICVSVSGRDPRKVAIEELALPPGSLDTLTIETFVIESVFSILFVGDDKYVIESINHSLIDIKDQHDNRCVSAPGAAKLIVSQQYDRRGQVELHGILDLQ